MQSPATRSGRLTKTKQSLQEKDKDAVGKKRKAEPSPAKSPAPSGRTRKSSAKSPSSTQETIEKEKDQPKKGEMDRFSSKDATENVSKQLGKLSSNKLDIPSQDCTPAKDKVSHGDEKKVTALTPTAALRRSSRAPVPSSRFKDMELVLTPNAQKMKRSLITSPSTEDSAPSPKKSKKSSNKLMSTAATEDPVPSVETEVKEDSHDPQIQEVHESPLEYIVPTPQEDNRVIKKDETRHEEMSIAMETVASKPKLLQKESEGTEKSQGIDLGSFEDKANDNEETAVIERNELDKHQDEKVTSVGMNNEEMTVENEKEKGEISEDNLSFVPSDITVNVSADAVAVNSQEVAVEEVGLSCHDAGIIVEETVHTYMEEKDVVIQDQNVVEKLEEKVDLSEIQEEKETEMSPVSASSAIPASILLKGQEVTVQERDGKMVAVVKIPANFGNHFSNSPLSEAKQGIKNEISTEDQFPMSSSLKNIILNAPANQKNRHGYILNKKSEKQSIVTISEQDQSSLLNISLEPTTISSIIKSKQDSSPTKSNSKSLYGRVIKQDAVIAKTNAETSSLGHNAPAANIVIKNVGSNKKISLLSNPTKAKNSKESKPYSLLSPPSELLQKLKFDSEKKPAPVIQQESLKTPPLSTTPQKVVIISHTPKSDSQGSLKFSEQVNHVEAVKESDGPVESSMDSYIVSLDSEVKSDSQSEQQDKLPPIPSSQVEEEVTSVEECVSTSDSGKLGEVTIESPLHEDGQADSKVQVEEDPKVETESESSNPVKGDDRSKAKEVLIESVETYAALEENGDSLANTVLISHQDKAEVEETVITSSAQPEIQVKQEVGLETHEAAMVEGSIKPQSVEGKEKGVEASAPKTQKIKLVDNGVVYELQIVSDADGKTLKDDTIQLEGMDGEASMVVKQEIVEDEESANGESTGKSSLGTQTIYAAKRGRPRVSGDKEDSDSPVHKLATIVQEGGQMKHYYYVSVVPGKTMDGKYRRSVDHALPGCDVNDVGEYCCKECDYKTDKKANFYKHRRLHTGAKPHVCQVCKYQARTSSNLKRHMGIHEDIREFKCNQCSLSFRQKIHLERHIRYRHEEKRVKCPMCDYVCANEQPDLKMHIKRKHTQESGKVFTCPQCNIEVGSKRDLKQHLKFHKDGPELKLFCKECSFVTDCKSRLQRHLVVHSNVKPYHCGVCDYKATQKEHVVRHLRSQHNIEVNKPKRPWKKQVKQETPETIGGNSRGDFTCGDKIFACNHCTMRFAKLINLYKHLHTQHSDIMPAETESNYYCVVCEFSTSSKKNLLVHMRRHNMTDQTPPTHVYSCVLCRYVNPRRRNLFQHMRKKHNIDISTQVDIAGMTEEEEAAVRQDGEKMAEFIQTEPGVFTQTSLEEVSSSNFETVEGGTQAVKDSLAGVANMIKIEDLTRVSASTEGKDGASLVIDNSDGTQLIQANTVMQHKAADAIEGLQALAGQAGLIIDEGVNTLGDKQSTIVIDQGEGTAVINSCDATLADRTIILSADQGIVEEQVAMEETASEQVQQIVDSVESSEANSGMTSLELTEEQLSSLHHGDIVQMENQVYMVEVTQDPENADKHLLSFLPIT